LLKSISRSACSDWGIDDLNVKDVDVTIKIGIYDPRALNHPTLETAKAVVGAFDRVHRIFLAESNNSVGGALERLQTLRETFTERVLPFNLSEDENVRDVKVINEKINLSHILYEPYVRVSFHAFRGLRGPGETLYGSMLKNLLGVIPDIKKERFHNKLSVALVDIMEATKRGLGQANLKKIQILDENIKNAKIDLLSK